jgi:hypothetical protein
LEVAETLERIGQVEKAKSALLSIAHDIEAESWDRYKAAMKLCRLDWTDEAAAILLSLIYAEDMIGWPCLRIVNTLIELNRVSEAANSLLSIASDTRLQVRGRWFAVEGLWSIGREEEAMEAARSIMFDTEAER